MNNATGYQMTVIVIYDNVKRNSKVALDEKLHHGGEGLMMSLLQSEVDRKEQRYFVEPTINIVVIIKNNKDYIGSCLIYDKRIMVYVKPEYRGSGFGSLLVNETLLKSGVGKNDVYSSAGVDKDESIEFWNRNGIFVLDSDSPIYDFYDARYLDEEEIKYEEMLLRTDIRSQLKEQGFDNRHFLWNNDF